MSALRKLRKAQMERELAEKAKALENKQDDDPEDPPRDSGFAVLSNSFGLSEAAETTEVKAEDDTESSMSVNSIPKKKKKKKKKKKGSGARADSKATGGKEKQDIDAIIAEISGVPNGNSNNSDKPRRRRNKNNRQKVPLRASLRTLKCDVAHFDWKRELKRMFGSRVVSGGGILSSKGGRRGIVSRRQEGWPTGGGGINMVFKHIQEGKSVFTFSRDLEYSVLEQDYLACKNTMDPRAISMFHAHNPFHAGANLQIAEILLHTGEFKQAADLVERAVHVYELGYHSKFDPLSGSARLLLDREESKEYLGALRRHAQCLGRRGCARTALEVCKFALSLTPETDPMCIMSFIGYYALRSKEYDWLLEFEREFLEYPIPAKWFPNIMFNAALALRLSTTGGKKKPETESKSKGEFTSTSKSPDPSNRLQRAIRIYPQAVTALVDAIDNKILKTDPRWEFAREWQSKRVSSPFVEKLILIFASRSSALWRSPPTLAWLRDTARAVYEDEKKGGKGGAAIIEENKLISSAFDIDIPITYKTLQKADYTDAMPQLPPEFFQQNQPPPPVGQEIPLNPPSAGEGGRIAGNPFAMFFRSLLPNFDPEALAQATAVIEADQRQRLLEIEREQERNEENKERKN